MKLFPLISGIVVGVVCYSFLSSNPTRGKKIKLNKKPTIQEKGIVTPAEEIKIENVTGDNSYSIVLEDPGHNKIGVIKAIRDFTDLGLKEEKDLIGSVPFTPFTIKTVSELSDAEDIQKTFSDLGARVTIE